MCFTLIKVKFTIKSFTKPKLYIGITQKDLEKGVDFNITNICVLRIVSPFNPCNQ